LYPIFQKHSILGRPLGKLTFGRKFPECCQSGGYFRENNHFLCARGDTFRLRAVENQVDSSGNVIEQGYCKAIVQRIPDCVNKNENAADGAQENSSRISKQFGCRYKLILFRWLDNDDI
jgi:hypothetical protein